MLNSGQERLCFQQSFANLKEILSSRVAVDRSIALEAPTVKAAVTGSDIGMCLKLGGTLVYTEDSRANLAFEGSRNLWLCGV